LIRKNISLKDFEEDAVKDPEVMDLTKKIKIKIDHDLEGRPLTPSKIRVELKNGEIIVEKIDIMKGQPKNPLDREELLKKFQELCSYSVVHICPH